MQQLYPCAAPDSRRSPALLFSLACLVPLLAACGGTAPAGPAGKAASGPLLVAAAEGEARLEGIAVGSSSYGDYLAGLVASNQNDVTAAADFLLQVHKSDPANYEVLRNTFSLVAADGRYAEAVRLARRIVEIDPNLTTANVVLAIDAIVRDDKQAGMAILAQLPKTGLNTMVVPLLASWISLEKDGIEGALAALAPLQDTAGLATLYHMQAALLNDVAGRVAEAEAAYNAALESAPQASLRLAWLAGNFFERKGQPEAAKNAYQGYLAGNPDSFLFEKAFARIEAGTQPAPTIGDYRHGLAEALFNLASLLSQERAELLAMIHVQQALRLESRFEVGNLLLGEILQSQRRGKQAIAVYRNIDPASPFAWSARLRIADEMERLGRSAEAIAELEALAQERTDQYEPLFRIGNILRVEERFKEAVVAYDRGFERVKGSEASHWTLFYFRGIALERSGEWERAEADFLKALELMPEQPYVMNYLAYSWVEQRQNLEEAQRMLIRAVELRPTDGFIVDSLGWVYYRLQKYDEAVAQLEKAVELRPQDPVINDHLGDAYWRVGRKQEARFQWRRALSLDPEPDEVPKIENKLKQGLVGDPENI
ncbi:MAG: tetratricopeptide repeat protein [Kiloniellales bacterium]